MYKKESVRKVTQLISHKRQTTKTLPVRHDSEQINIVISTARIIFFNFVRFAAFSEQICLVRDT